MFIVKLGSFADKSKALRFAGCSVTAHILLLNSELVAFTEYKSLWRGTLE